jgi:hypothetical protein
MAAGLRVRRFRIGRLIVLLALSLLLCGCDRDSSETLDRVRRSIESWSATVDTTIDQWGEGRVPRQYVRQIIASADKALGEQGEALEKVAASDARREALQRDLSDLRRRVHDLSGTVERGDPTAARTVAKRRER